MDTSPVVTCPSPGFSFPPTKLCNGSQLYPFVLYDPRQGGPPQSRKPTRPVFYRIFFFYRTRDLIRRSFDILLMPGAVCFPPGYPVPLFLSRCSLSWRHLPFQGSYMSPRTYMNAGSPFCGRPPFLCIFLQGGPTKFLPSFPSLLTSCVDFYLVSSLCPPDFSPQLVPQWSSLSSRLLALQ